MRYTAVLNGWFIVTIMAPLMAPVIGLLILRLLPIPGSLPGLKLMTTVKDGQLGWAVIAMGSSAMYELWGILAAGRPVLSWGGWAFGGLILVMLSAMLVAAGGAVFSIPLLPTAAEGVKAWVTHYKLFVGSAFMAAVVAFLYTSIHFLTSP